MVKKLASHVREYKKYAIMTPILVLGEVVLEILIPLFMAELIDSGIDAGSMPEIISSIQAGRITTELTRPEPLQRLKTGEGSPASAILPM